MSIKYELHKKIINKHIKTRVMLVLMNNSR